jgi:hypothetical protein
MKNRQTGEKRRKEMRRLERQRDKADKKATRRRERALGEGSGQPEESLEGGVLGVEGVDASLSASVVALSSAPGHAVADVPGGVGGGEKPLP